LRSRKWRLLIARRVGSTENLWLEKLRIERERRNCCNGNRNTNSRSTAD
jgi:hypothetical protein